MTSTVATLDCAADPVDAALSLARAFTAGKRLVVSAEECVDHAHHVAVEFVHPVIAGARSLPAVVVSPDHRSRSTDVRLEIGPGPTSHPDFSISGDLSDAEIMRTYHVLWELVQVSLEHPGLVGGSPSEGGDSTGFLYPFLDASETDEASLRASLASSAEGKRTESALLSEQSLTINAGVVSAAANALVDSVESGGRVLVMGNGGSASDASRLVRLLGAVGVDALSLASDYAIISALANDLGVDRVFARQVEAFARPGDVLVGCSTSGSSGNLLAAFDRARAQGVTTVGICGYGGSAFVAEAKVEHCLVVASESVHRIQEAEAALMSELVSKLRFLTEASRTEQLTR